MSQQSQGKIMLCTDLLDEGITLGASVLQKLKANIWSNEFTDLRTVLTFKEDPLSVTISSGVINLNQESQFKTPMSICEWTNAFLVSWAIYLEKYPNDAPCVRKNDLNLDGTSVHVVVDCVCGE